MRFASFLVASSLLLGAVVPACSDPLDVEGDDDDEKDAGGGKADSSTTRPDASKDGGGKADAGKSDAGKDAGRITAEDACEGELETYNACELDGMQCGPDKYVAWCHTNEIAVDSEQRITARALCLGTDYCEPAVRGDCIYEQYNDLAMTPAQTALLEHYCAACEPADQAACKTRTQHYDGNPASTDTIFLAAWELSATLVQQIDDHCIDAATQGDAGTCADRFDDCAGGYYVDALVADCPAD